MAVTQFGSKSRQEKFVREIIDGAIEYTSSIPFHPLQSVSGQLSTIPMRIVRCLSALPEYRRKKSQFQAPFSFSPLLTCAKWGVRFINPLPIPHPTSATSDYIVGSIVPDPLLPSIHPIVPEGEGFSYSPLITREVRGGRRRKGGGVASH